MRKQDIEITISPSGEVSFTVKGVKGASCIDATKFLEQALGGEILEREPTSEYYEQGESAGAGVYAGSGEGDDD
jgi:Protein of unknown function (DUF2997)